MNKYLVIILYIYISLQKALHGQEAVYFLNVHFFTVPQIWINVKQSQQFFERYPPI